MCNRAEKKYLSSVFVNRGYVPATYVHVYYPEHETVITHKRAVERKFYQSIPICILIVALKVRYVYTYLKRILTLIFKSSITLKLFTYTEKLEGKIKPYEMA